MSIPAYAADDVVGDVYLCPCVPPRAKHPFCENCLILIGPSHHERLRMAALLPVHGDHFNEETGLWERGMKDVPSYVCQTCKEDIERNPAYATPRFVRTTSNREKRIAREKQWEALHPDVPRYHTPGSFVSLPPFSL